MSKSSMYISTVICVTILTSAAFVAQSGPINPPIGPVGASGPSLTDVFNAVSLPAGSELTISEPRIKDPGVASEPGTLARLVVTDSLGVVLAGDDIVGGIPNSVKVVGFTHNINVPFDPLTGLAAGVKVHFPWTMTKEVDASTPKLMEACVSGTNFPEVRLELFRFDPVLGGEVKYFTYTLTNARVVDIKPITAGSSTGQAAHMEEVTFTYQKVKYTYVPTGASFEDSWQAPPAP